MNNMNKKNIFTFFLIIIILLYPLTVHASLKDNVIDILPNGGYITEEVNVYENSISHLSTNHTKSGDKILRYKDSSGKTLWYIKVIGTFSYNGKKSTCTKSNISTVTHTPLWTFSNKSHSKTSNKAIANATAKQYSNYVCIKSISKKVVLQCSETGKLS